MILIPWTLQACVGGMHNNQGTGCCSISEQKTVARTSHHTVKRSVMKSWGEGKEETAGCYCSTTHKLVTCSCNSLVNTNGSTQVIMELSLGLLLLKSNTMLCACTGDGIYFSSFSSEATPGIVRYIKARPLSHALLKLLHGASHF